jgi:nitrogen fixation protein FixH
MTSLTKPGDRRAWFWASVPVLLLGGLLGTQLLFLAGSLDDPSFVVEDDYYQKAVSWDVKMAEDRENARLGWAVNLSLRSARSAPSTAVVDLADSAGAGIAGANVKLLAFHNARASDVQSVTLRERAPGSYEGELRLTRPGLWEFRVSAARSMDRFTHVVRKDVYPESGH